MTVTADQYGAEEYEITDDGRLSGNVQPLRSARYPDGSTIDWLQQDAAERERKQALRSQTGVRGMLSPVLEATRMWLVVIVTGTGIGLTGAWLDILVKWCAFSSAVGGTLVIEHAGLETYARGVALTDSSIIK